MRLFISLPCTGDVRAAVAGACRSLREADWPIRWTDPAKLHITLRWLGDIGESLLDPATKAMREAAAASKRFDLQIRTVGAFPSLRKPRVTWVGVEGGEDLHRLHDTLDRALARNGFTRAERAFRPHMTIGRTRRGARPRDFTGFDAAARGVRLDARYRPPEIQLVESVLGSGGARYRIRARAPLAP